MVKVDFSLHKINYEIVPEGIYLTEIVKVQLKPTKNKKGNYLCWTLKIIDSCDCMDSKLFIITPLKETALWKLKKLLKIINYPTYSNVVDIDSEEMAGRKLKVKVIQEMYQGRLYNKVIDFESID